MPINRREFKKIVDVLESMVKEKDAEESVIRHEPEPAVAVKNFLAGERLDQQQTAMSANLPPSETDNGNFQRLYLRIKNRIIDECRVDPVLLHLLTTRPEMVVEVEPRLFTLNTDSVKGKIGRLIAQGWFLTVKTGGATRAELKRTTGTDPGGGNIPTYLAEFTRDGFLVKDGDGFVQAPGVKITEKTLESRA